MQPIRSALRKSFFLAAILSFLFVGGIPAIVLGAVNGIGAVMGIGIGATVVGFYGAPASKSISTPCRNFPHNFPSRKRTSAAN